MRTRTSSGNTPMAMHRRTILSAALLAMILGFGLALPAPAWAGPVGDAKAAGHVGEQPNGYLAARPGAPANVQALVGQANARRKAEYQAIATKRGGSLAAVEAVAGKKRIAASPPGSYILSGGKWRRK